MTSIGGAELCLRSLELCDAGLVLPQLVFVPAELLRADGVLLLERLDSLQEATTQPITVVTNWTAELKR